MTTIGYRRFGVALGLVLAGLAAGAPARADDGNDVVYLRSGGIVRGVVLEYEPNGQARVKLADGQVRTIASDLIARVEMGGPGAAAPPASAPSPAPETARLHVESPEPVEVVGRPNDGYEWAPVCVGSCDQAVRLDWEYRVRGDGIKSSAPFQLAASRGQPVNVAVDPASSSGFALGIVGMVGGGVAAYVGLVVMLLGSVKTTTTNMNGTAQVTTGGNDSLVTAGGVTLAAGGAIALAGTVATISNRSTRVRQTSRADAPTSARLPFWHTAERSEIPIPSAFQAPVITLHF